MLGIYELNSINFKICNNSFVYKKEENKLKILFCKRTNTIEKNKIISYFTRS